jgi:hypothetical protein
LAIVDERVIDVTSQCVGSGRIAIAAWLSWQASDSAASAVGSVGLHVDALGSAASIPGGADTLAVLAHRVGPALRPAGPAIGRVGLRVDARTPADKIPSGAHAHAILADIVETTLRPAGTTVARVAHQVGAEVSGYIHNLESPRIRSGDRDHLQGCL